MSAVSLRAHVRLPNGPSGPHVVEVATFDALRTLVPADRWELMLTPPTPDDPAGPSYRAWLRAKLEHQSPARIMGRPASTAEGAVRNLVAKVEPMARPAGVMR